MAAKTRAVLPFCFVVMLLGVLSYPVQAPSSQQQGSLGPQTTAGDGSEPVYRSATVLKYTSRLILVDVIASNHKGEPVRDLKPQDFALTEDGKKQDVRVFEFQSPDSNPEPPAQDQPKMAAGEFTNAPRRKVTRALNVLLLDSLNSNGSDQNYAKDQMLRFLEKLPTDQPVAVYLLGSKLRLLLDFTTDPALLKKAVQSLKSETTVLADKPAGEGQPIEQYPSGILLENLSSFPQMLAQVRQFQEDNAAMQTDFRLHMSLAALQALARTLAGYPGRKNLIWFSESFPLAVLPTTYPVPGQAGVASLPGNIGLDTSNYQRDVARTASILTDAQVAIYPVDVRALIGNQFYSSLRNTSDNNGDYLGRVTTGRSVTATNKVEARGQLNDELNITSNELDASHASMNELADRTGGKSYYNRNEINLAVQKAIDDGSTYYTLGYYPANKDWNGKFRRISVKTEVSGVKLRYRTGYFATDPQIYSKLDPRAKAAEFGLAMSIDFPTSTALIFRGRVIPPSPETKNRMLVNFAINPRQITFEEKDGMERAQVDCAIAAFSQKGAPIKAEGGTSIVNVKPDQLGTVNNSVFTCQRQLELPPGDYILRLGVRDNLTGLMGTANATVTIH